MMKANKRIADEATKLCLVKVQGEDVLAGEWDDEGYLEANPFVLENGQDPWEHYTKRGWHNGALFKIMVDDVPYLGIPDLKAYNDMHELGFTSLKTAPYFVETQAFHHYRDEGREAGLDMPIREPHSYLDKITLRGVEGVVSFAEEGLTFTDVEDDTEILRMGQSNKYWYFGTPYGYLTSQGPEADIALAPCTKYSMWSPVPIDGGKVALVSISGAWMMVEDGVLKLSAHGAPLCPAALFECSGGAFDSACIMLQSGHYVSFGDSIEAGEAEPSESTLVTYELVEEPFGVNIKNTEGGTYLSIGGEEVGVAEEPGDDELIELTACVRKKGFMVLRCNESYVSVDVDEEKESGWAVTKGSRYRSACHSRVAYTAES
ncbi:unnamed protein product [Chrysoparadoxa australica]